MREAESHEMSLLEALPYSIEVETAREKLAIETDNDTES